MSRGLGDVYKRQALVEAVVKKQKAESLLEDLF